MMDVSAITSNPTIGGVGQHPLRPESTGAKSPFADAIADVLRNVNEQQLTAQQHVTDLATGATDNLHDVVLSVAQADLAFQLVLEIRNRLIASYQELLRMQV